MRLELSPAQQAEHLARRKEVWEALKAIVGQDVQQSAGRPKTFERETADAVGVSAKTIKRDTARAEALGDDLRAIAGTSLDKGVEMDALAKLPEENRRPLIAAAQRGEKVSAREVVEVVDGYDAIANQADAIVRACPCQRLNAALSVRASALIVCPMYSPVAIQRVLDCCHTSTRIRLPQTSTGRCITDLRLHDLPKSAGLPRACWA